MPKVLAVGSVLDFARASDVVVGVGLHWYPHDVTQQPATSQSTRQLVCRLRCATVRAVRGRRTCGELERMGYTCSGVTFLDPAVTSSLLLPPWRGLRWVGGGGLCVLAQGSDVQLRKRLSGQKGVTSIGHQWSPVEIARTMQTCDLVASSSLHGIIFADSLRVPAVWWVHKQQGEPRAAFGEPPGKYLDYFSGVGRAEPIKVHSFEQATGLMKNGTVHPALSTERLYRIASDYVRSFPFAEICRPDLVRPCRRAHACAGNSAAGGRGALWSTA